MKRFVTFLISMLLIAPSFAFAAQASEGDIQIIEQRMYNNFKKGVPSSGEIERILALISPNGSFSDIDYAEEEFNSGDKKRRHFSNLAKLAKAYVEPLSKYHHNKQLYKSIEGLLIFWLSQDIEDENWWHRSIGFPKDMLPTLVLMSESLKANNPQLYQDLLSYLDYSRLETSPRLQLGANGTDISKITFTRAVLSRDQELLSSIMERVSSLIFIAKGGVEEGIYPDYSFSQHSTYGRQLYLGTYGREFLDGALFFKEYTNATEFDMDEEKVALIEDLIINGVAWMWYKDELDSNQLGRKIFDKTNFAPSFVAIVQRMIALNTPKKKELQQVLDMMRGRSQITGNKAYPYHDYMIHRGDDYMTTIRMTSKRTVGNEAGNGQGFENYHTGDGASYFRVYGDEYSSIFGKWNWRFIPGTTVVADERKMPIPMWGKGGKGGDDYAVVASSGEVGVAGFIFRKDSLLAHKAWFNLENVTIALGAGITTERTDAKVITTINQTALKGKVYSSDSKNVWHSNIGYKSLDGQDIKVQKDKSILKLSLEHNLSPQNASYAYAVYPNIELERFNEEESPSFTLLRNDASVQAIIDNTNGTIMAIFYTPAELQIDKKLSLSASMPSALICTLSTDGYNVHVGNPFCETKNIDEISVQMLSKKKEVKLSMQN